MGGKFIVLSVAGDVIEIISLSFCKIRISSLISSQVIAFLEPSQFFFSGQETTFYAHKKIVKINVFMNLIFSIFKGHAVKITLI
jgi:hypothetical protein